MHKYPNKQTNSLFMMLWTNRKAWPAAFLQGGAPVHTVTGRSVISLRAPAGSHLLRNPLPYLPVRGSSVPRR